MAVLVSGIQSRCRPRRRWEPDRAVCCVPIPVPIQTPDVAIYSQEEQLSVGNPPTWDNPDILTNYWRPFRLMPEVSVTIRNLSSINAVNVQVAISTSAFGIGMPRTPSGSKTLSLAGGQQQVILFPVSQALLNAPDPRIGAFVDIIHPHDRKLINNKGVQLLADEYTSAVGRAFTVNFPVLNSAAVAQQITLSALNNDLNAARGAGPCHSRSESAGGAARNRSKSRETRCQRRGARAGR